MQENDGQAAGPSAADPRVKAVRDAFAARFGSCLTNVTVSLENDQIALGGTTRSYYYKQMAQETVRSVLGPAVTIRNGIVVQY